MVVTKKTKKKKSVAKKKSVVGKKTKKKSSVKATSYLSAAQRKKIDTALKDVEAKILANYQKVVVLSGKDWSKEGKKYKKIVQADLGKVRKRIELEVRNDPKKAAAVGAAIAALAGAVFMSMFRKKR
ncbi:MAG: hypothetical protein KKD39_02325 [Candidatus Altiarchaeota archaeon]|nr:hypothetical protein [Candidatus Altiarchaeota archaeon]